MNAFEWNLLINGSNMQADRPSSSYAIREDCGLNEYSREGPSRSLLREQLLKEKKNINIAEYSAKAAVMQSIPTSAARIIVPF